MELMGMNKIEGIPMLENAEINHIAAGEFRNFKRSDDPWLYEALPAPYNICSASNSDDHIAGSF